MKSLLLAASLLAAGFSAQAQFNPPAGPEQKIDVRAGGATDTRSATGSPGSLDASASEGGSSAWASTRLGPGYLSGSLDTHFNGSGASSASLSAYQRDALTFQRTDGGDPSVVVYYNIVIAGGTSAAIDPVAPPAGGGEAGSVDWTFVHRLDGFYTTSWDSTTRLGYDGSVSTASHWNVGEIGKVYGVYTFAAAVMAGSAMDMEFYLEMNSRLNTAGLSTSGSLAANAPSIYWGGISQVTDWYGNRVGYSVSSASGFNYALSAAPSPAPEPATWAMLLAGVAVLVLRRRSVRGAHQAQARISE